MRLTETPRYIEMLNISVQLHQLQRQLIQFKQTPASREQWQRIEEGLARLQSCVDNYQAHPELQPEVYEEEEWSEWKELIQTTSSDYQEALRLLIEAKEQFYQEVRQVGQTVKAHQAYNEMKRIRF